jgi:hypothetical protein
MMLENRRPTAYRIEDPGLRALFKSSRYQAWLDVEAALAPTKRS